MRLEGVARRYAWALLDAVPREDWPNVDRELETAAHQMAEPPLSRIWLHPGITADDKKRLVASLTYSTPVERFLGILAEHRRERLLADAARQFHVARLERSGQVVVEVRTARPLEPDRQHRLVRALTDRLGRPVQATFSHDPALLGGIEIRLGDRLWDGTVRGRLQRLGQALKNGVNRREA
jgi:ATP synthase, F1 delta subunit